MSWNEEIFHFNKNPSTDHFRIPPHLNYILDQSYFALIAVYKTDAGEKMTKEKGIGYFIINFSNAQGKYFNSTVFTSFINDFQKTIPTERQQDYKEKEKAINLETLEERSGIYHMIFKSCKYNYSPNYMSKNDGSERESDKEMYEGDKVLTHACMKICETGAYIALEQNKFGVQYYLLAEYLQHYMNNVDSSIKMEIGILADKDIYKIIEDARRITSIQVESDYKSIISDEYKNLITDENCMKEDITLSLRAERGKSLDSRFARTLVDRTRNIINRNGVNRVRIYVKDKNGMTVILDTLQDSIKDNVKVTLNRDGTVDSQDILIRIERLLQQKQFDNKMDQLL